MHLFIMRHGPAEPGSSSGRDFNRALSARGRERTEAVAEELRRRGEVPVRILSSPLVRAVQTAGIVASVLRSGIVPEETEDLAPSESAAGLGLVHSLVAGSVASALLVGHAPDVSLLAGALLGVHVGGFDAATIVALEVRAGAASRRFVLEPSAIP